MVIDDIYMYVLKVCYEMKPSDGFLELPTITRWA